MKISLLVFLLLFLLFVFLGTIAGHKEYATTYNPKELMASCLGLSPQGINKRPPPVLGQWSPTQQVSLRFFGLWRPVQIFLHLKELATDYLACRTMTGCNSVSEGYELLKDIVRSD